MAASETPLRLSDRAGAQAFVQNLLAVMSELESASAVRATVFVPGVSPRR